MPISKEELEELLQKLGKIRGRHTELVTVYIPSEANIYTVAGQIDAEKSTADNIKSKTTRKNVMDALERISRELKLYRETPPNGLVLFCGNISEKEGQDDIQLWALEPPQPLKVRMYRCDQTFVTEPLTEMVNVTEVYGLVVMDRKDATFGLLEGKQVKILRKITSGVPGKFSAGGQCLAQDTKVIEKNKGEIRLKDVKEGYFLEGLNLDNAGLVFNKCKNKWITKKKNSLLIITNGEYPSSEINPSLDHIFYSYNENKIIEKIASKLKVGDFLIAKNGKMIKILSIDNSSGGELIDIEVENKNFFANGLLVHNSAARFDRWREGMAKEFYRKVAEHMKELYFEMPKLKGIIIGGPMPTKEDFMKEGQLITALKEKVIGLKDLGYADEHGIDMLVEASEDLLEQQEIMHEKLLLDKFFEKLGKGKGAVYGIDQVKKAIEYGAVDTLIISKKLKNEETHEIERTALNISAKIETVSTETPEGEQFFNIGGIGAVLRFEIQ